MKLAVLALLTLPLWANHQAIQQVEYLPGQKCLKVTGVVHDEEEHVLETRNFEIHYDTRIMWEMTGDARLFSEKEQSGMLQGFQTLVEAFTQVVPNIAGAKLEKILWQMSTKSITLTIGDRTLVIKIDGTINEGDKSILLEAKVKETLWAFSAAVMQYCAESIEWWDAGQGEPVIPKGRKV